MATGIVLGDNSYGKAECRLVHVERDPAGHRLTDLSVSVALGGDLAATHYTGDNTAVLPTDTQKNTVYAFARDGVGQIEDFGLRLARHFVHSQPTIHRARITIEQYGWQRNGDHPHSFVRGAPTRTATVTCGGEGEWVVSGVADLTVLNTTESEFHGFIKDRYTTLPETADRILATAVSARWRHGSADNPDWARSHAEAVRHLLDAFADTHSCSLQQTLYAMASRVLEHRPELVEARLSLPNKHHFLLDLSPFGLDNPDAVYHAADRPYGLIEGTAVRAGAAPAGQAW
ncbi:MAG TPA: urate oxidase [Pseudonocardiaceae bacterium]|nr:urate oxidase [Pseudonocardiaceae bacterium]